MYNAALYVIPPCLFIYILMIVVAKAYADYVVYSKYLFDGSRDGYLYFFGRLLAANIVLIRSSDGLPTPRSRIMLTWNLL
jgi:hypothetical protein